MLLSAIRRAVILGTLCHCRERWEKASLVLQARLLFLTPGVAEAFVAYAAGQGNAVVAGILCSRAIGGARQWAAGIGALDPVRSQGRFW